MLSSDTLLRLKSLDTEQSYLVAGTTTIYHHALVATNADGYLVPADDTAGLRPVGLAAQAVDNQGGADGAKRCLVYKGAVRIPTSGASALVQADVGGKAYILDDETVVKAAGTTNSIEAGEVLEIESTFAWVRVG